jgi:hypothetical protein
MDMDLDFGGHSMALWSGMDEDRIGSVCIRHGMPCPVHNSVDRAILFYDLMMTQRLSIGCIHSALE